MLNLIPGLLDVLPGARVTHTAIFSTVTDRTLVLHDAPSRLGEHYGIGPEFGMQGVQREQFHRILVEQAAARGIPIHWGYHLEGLTELEHEIVELRFANGETAQASFVVGCDGLHSNTRSALFGEIQPDYTGMVQVKSPISSCSVDLNEFTSRFSWFTWLRPEECLLDLRISRA